MAKRETFTTTIDKAVQNRFKAKCAERGLKMNDLLTVFMEMYSDGKFNLVLELDDKKTIVRETE